MTFAPRVFFGAAENPFAPPFDWRPFRLAKKIAAGAQFIQTQYCYDVPRLEAFMARAGDLGLPERAFILVGVGPLRSAKTAEWMRTHVPGVHIPDEIIRRMAGARRSGQGGPPRLHRSHPRNPHDQRRVRRARDGLSAGRSRGRSDHRIRRAQRPRAVVSRSTAAPTCNLSEPPHDRHRRQFRHPRSASSASTGRS